jgi:hypothetical protein
MKTDVTFDSVELQLFPNTEVRECHALQTLG